MFDYYALFSKNNATRWEQGPETHVPNRSTRSLVNLVPAPNKHRRATRLKHTPDSIGNQCIEWTVVNGSNGWSNHGMAIQSAPSDVEQDRILSIDRRLVRRNTDSHVQPAVPAREVVF